MKKFDVIAQILSEASGRSLEDVRLMTDVIFKMAGSRDNLDKDLPEPEAQELLAKLRSELPGIRAWLIKGRLMVETDIAKAEGRVH